MSRYSRPLAVALLSASTLAYEILLVRVFGIEQFHHFAYMAIGVAMLGFGAAGTLLALVRPGPTAAERGFVAAALATPLALVASATLVHLIPLDATQLPWSLRPWLKLALVYLLLALPFAVGALAVLLALVLERERAGLVYGASFVGAGLGATLALSILWVALPWRALAVPAAAGAVGAATVAVARRGPAVVAIACAALALAALALIRPPWELRINPYKALPQVEAYPEARRVTERADPVGWVVAVEAAAFHHAPGLSLGYQGEFPPQSALFVDGDIAGATTDWSGQEDRRLLDWLPTATPYVLGEVESVLVVGAGGGTEVWNAVEHGARRVRAVELHGGIAELARESMAENAIPDAIDVRWVVADGRRYVSSAGERFDLVTLGPGRGFGASAAGVHALNEDYLHTVEAYRDYLGGLTEDGVLAISGWVTVPPRRSLRTILTVGEALRGVTAGEIGDRLVVVRSWATFTVLAKPSGFEPRAIEALTEWTRSRGFDLDWRPGIERPTPGFNLLDEPVLYEAAAAAVEGAEAAEAFEEDYPFTVGPVGDGRPYPHHYLRAGSLSLFFGAERGSVLPIAEWGYVALIATLAQSLVLAAVLLLGPVLLGGGATTGEGLGLVLAYFSAIGLGFMAAEIAAIQQLTLLLGHPVYAVASVLVVLLVFSGVGSMRSDRWSARHGWAAAAVLAVIMTIYAAGLLPLSRALQPAALPARGLVTVSVLAPLAFLMGTPFPLGLRGMARGAAERVAWAWAANGFASVVATPLAALIALEAGSRVLWLTAGLAYAGAALSYRAGRTTAATTARSRARA
ncbi:MAG: hypothetical protein GWN99_16520 [Gemmatimonadetes bacterium]|uniref:Spermidine synthase n=1 Tax=Candidatus Kutchimonas denitrificans TaxID=3056748 RepID=A0AAE4Z604_9BACT|nr:hypothetical protein [Gemmatimonadota bacterium]NIR74394.1 hypothetical protein [Candidatus Kutchimonas denitrificans]NIS02645.1 hypothetical protein [Gemmatimonadota bacterium]NIT68520.1 hypothetical protein [Gemmatimonadota bacterium]NIU51997.1 hypothetical protein [Gemmatimonadota bacterium]